MLFNRTVSKDPMFYIETIKTDWLAHLSRRLKVRYCDRSLSVVRLSMRKLFL